MTEDLPPVQAPFPVTAPYRVVPAPRPLRRAPRPVIDAAWPAAQRRRLERLSTDLDGVLVLDPEADEAPLRAALEAAHTLLPEGRAAAVCDEPECREVLAGLSGARRLAAQWLLSCSDDLVVLRRRGAGQLRAELLAVSFPSGWPPRHRAGASLLELHAPVADGERLQRAAPALSEALLTKGPHIQWVWGLDPDGRLDRDPSAPDAASYDVLPPADQWWLRVEEQTTLPLPDLDRALFLIRPFLTPVSALAAEQRTVLAAAVDSMSSAARAYKGLPEGFAL